MTEAEPTIRDVADQVMREANALGNGITEDTTPLYWASNRLMSMVADRRLDREEEN